MKMEQKNNIISYLKLYQDLYSNEIYINKTSVKQNNYYIFGLGNEKSNFIFLDYFDLSSIDDKKFSYKNSGTLLDKMLNAIDLKRENVYIITFFKYNNPLLLKEYPVNQNINYKDKIKQIKPKLIISLGKEAFLQLQTNFKNIDDEKILKYNSSDLMITLNPLELLKNNNLKKRAWSHLKLIRDQYINV